MKRRSVVALVSLLTVLIAAGCTEPTSPEKNISQQDSAGEINLYSSRHYDTDKELYNNFTAETGIKINLIEGKDDELIERIKSEGANSPADVLIAVDVARLWRAQNEGILQPISSSVLESAIPENLRSPDGYWFGISKRARVIVYNTNKVKPSELSTYEALAKPKWKGRICVRSSGNVYNQSLVASEIEGKGVEETEKWLKGFVANFAREPKGNDTAQIKAVAAGECDVALVNHYYFARLRQSEDAKDREVVAKIGIFFPNQKEGGTHINISGGGVAANAPHKENSIKFLEYLVTPEAQEIFANKNNEYPVIVQMKPNPAVANFGEFKESNLPIAGYGEENAEAVKLMDRSGWN